MLPSNLARRSCVVVVGVIVGCTGCSWLNPYRTPEDITHWQDPSPPKLSLREKAQVYQEGLEQKHLTPEGVVQYRMWDTGSPFGSYGDLADGPFQTGIYLSSQAHRYAATGDPDARQQVLLALNGLRTLMEVTGKRGLLARYLSLRDAIPAADREPFPDVPDSDLTRSQWFIRYKEWLPSTALTDYWWRPDVSKDQYAGFIHGLGVTLALVDDPGVRSLVAELSSAAADHLIENHLRIIDSHGEPTTHNNVAGRIGFIPIGINALLSLAIFKVAAASTGEVKYQDFYHDLLEKDYPVITYWAQASAFGWYKRVNDNMGYLALYPLLLLETDPTILRQLEEGERRSWRAVGEEHNAFFSFVHGAMVGELKSDLKPGSHATDIGRERGRAALFQYPDTKRIWPVDLTREGFNFPRAFFNGKNGTPRSTIAIPLYLRVRSSCFWASDPYRMVGTLGGKGDAETSGQDYLLPYWMGRYHRFVEENE